MMARSKKSNHCSLHNEGRYEHVYICQRPFSSKLSFAVPPILDFSYSSEMLCVHSLEEVCVRTTMNKQKSSMRNDKRNQQI